MRMQRRGRIPYPCWADQEEHTTDVAGESSQLREFACNQAFASLPGATPVAAAEMLAKDGRRLQHDATPTK